jgi:hypothetical protein
MVRCENYDRTGRCAPQKARSLRRGFATSREIPQDFAQAELGTIPAISSVWRDVTKI